MKTAEEILEQLKRNTGDFQGICEAIYLLGQLLYVMKYPAEATVTERKPE